MAKTSEILKLQNDLQDAEYVLSQIQHCCEATAGDAPEYEGMDFVLRDIHTKIRFHKWSKSDKCEYEKGVKRWNHKTKSHSITEKELYDIFLQIITTHP